MLGGKRVKLVPHSTLRVGDHVAALARSSTGWCLLSPNDYGTVSSRLGTESIQYDHLWTSEKAVVQQLWDCGLIAVEDGTTVASIEKEGSRFVYPGSILLKLTGGCNFACTYCYDYDPSRFRENLSAARAMEAIALLLRHRHHLAVTFHGGEPLLRFKLLREIVEFAEAEAGDPARLSFSIQTNASRMSGAVIEFLEQHRFSVGISIDGHNDAANRLRVVRSGPSALSYVLKLLDVAPDFVRRRCGFLMVVGRTSAPHLLDFAKWLQDNKLNSLGFSFLDEEGAGKGLSTERLAPDEVVEVWRTVVDAIRDGSIKELALTAVLSRIRNLFTLAPRDFCHRGPCGAASEFLVLDTTGQFRTCDCVYDPYFEAGDRLMPVEQLLKGLQPAQERVVNRHSWLSKNGPTCSTCSIFGLCGGTCVAKAIAAAGTHEAVDPGECAVSRYLYPILLAEFASREQPLLEYFAHHRGARVANAP